MQYGVVMDRSKSLFVYFDDDDDDDNVVNIIICRFKVDLRQRRNKKKADKSYTYCCDGDVFIYHGFGLSNDCLNT